MGFVFLALQHTLPDTAYQDLFPQNTVCNIRRHCNCFPQYPRLTFQKVLLIMPLQKVWKTIWGHNEIIRFLGWMIGMGRFFSLFNNRARNQLPLYIDQAGLILKFLSSQDMTDQFGNPWSQISLEHLANPKQWLVWSRPGLRQKSYKGKFRPLGRHIPMRGWQPMLGFQGTGWPSHGRTLFVCEPSIPTTVMTMAQFIFAALSFISSSVKMSLLDPFLRTGGSREHWAERMGSKIFRRQGPGD